MTETKPRSFVRNAVFYAVLILLLFVASIAVGEIAARIVKISGPSTFPFRTFDPTLGVALIPGAEGVHRRCYDGYVKINSHGMRDKERTIEKSDGQFRIAVFSDSIFEAVHVKPEETAALLLEERLNQTACRGRCEVLNFSVGGYSPLQYYLRYMKDGRGFHPDLVVVVLTDNDLPVIQPDQAKDHNNTGARTETFTVGNLYPSPQLIRSNGAYRIEKPAEPAMPNTLLTLFRTSDLAYFLYKFYNMYVKPPPIRLINDAAPDWAKFQPNYMFLDPKNPVAANAWQETKYVLNLFVDQARKDGARFLLVHWGYDVGSNPWYKPIPPDARLPDSFDPQYASKWFANYAREKGIYSYNLGAGLSSYVRSRKLTEPYLSFTCDMHLNPEGQSVMADLLFSQLMKGNLLPAVQ
jgi:hypothetical protein